MTDSRQLIMESVRTALKTALLPGSTPERPTNTTLRPSGGIEDFIAEVESLSGQVIRVPSSAEAAQAVGRLFNERGWEGALAWEWAEIGCDGLANILKEAGVSVVHNGLPADLSASPVGLTGAEAAIADTGTLVLRTGPGRSSLASLLPPTHVALLDASRVLPDMRGYFESLSESSGAAAHVRSVSNLVFISGPSRTADIEKTLTLGVHGPRELIVVVWG
jgi:L-lactate dehydrogenase complex protein LldG